MAVLKGYMYITPKHICFFAHMPDGDVSFYVSSEHAPAKANT